MTALKATALVVPILGAFGAGSRGCVGQAIASGAPALAPTRVEIYGGYAYFHPEGGTIAQRPYAAIQPGGVGSVTGYFNRYLGVQMEGAAFPNGKNDSVYTGQAGPVLRYSYGRIVPFVHVLGGTARVSGPASQPATWGWGLTGGVGVDYVLPVFGHRLAVRPIQADYQFSHVDYGKIALPEGLTGGLGEIKAFRLSAGVVLRFGGNLEKERPLMYSCEASPSTIFAGDPVSVTGSAVGPVTRNRSIYTWTSNGGRISGTDENATVTTSGLAPGDYTVNGQLSQGKHPQQNASCTASFTVQAPIPPTISCSANPVSVMPGGHATITALANSAQNRPLSYSYSANGRQIDSRIAIATLNTENAPPGQIRVECRVRDDLGQSATAVTVVNVSAPPAPMAQRRQLCTLRFSRDLKRPTRVDNEAKACLDDVALALNRDATSRLTITGESSADESAGQAVARASNARLYLTQEKGIDPSRIDVKTGTAAARAAEIELVPVGTPISYFSTSRTDANGVTTVTGSGAANSRMAQGATSDQGPAPSARPSPGMAAGAGGNSTMVPSPASTLDGPGTAGPRRSADSLVLPPLPADAVPGTRAYRAAHSAKHKTSTKHRRHRKLANPQTPGPSTTGTPTPVAPSNL